MRHTPRILAAVLALAGLSASVANASSVVSGEDLSGYYPNAAAVKAGYYLNGTNHLGVNPPPRSVLWFTVETNGQFKQYNWGPEDPKGACHWDLLQWTGGKLTYSVTSDGCGTVAKATIFNPPITVMPQLWNGQPWTLSGQSVMTQAENGRAVCTANNNWRADVLGWEVIAPATATTPAVQAIHVRTIQTVKWLTGTGKTVSGCRAGDTTNWQEDYYLMKNLPMDGGGFANAFKRTVGGNKDVRSDTWNIWFNSWSKMPKR